MPWRSTRPPSAAARAASKALDIRESLPPSRRGGRPTGLARGRQFKNRERMSISVIKRIISFHKRHDGMPNISAARRDPKSKASQVKGFWGGRAGFAWAKRELARYERSKKSNRSKN